MKRISCSLVALGLTATLIVACSGGEDPVVTTSDDLSTADAISRSELWVAAKLHYCQAANHQHDYDSACASVCNRTNNPQWDPYRSDCSGLVSWAWGLPAPGRVTGQFAPFQTDITKAIPASTLREGDAVNNSDHIMLFKKWSTPGSVATFIEEPGCSSATPYAHEFTSTVTISGTSIHVAENGMTFTAIRYSKLTTPPVDHPPTGKLEAADCTGIRGWAQDPDTATQPVSVKISIDAKPGTKGAPAPIAAKASIPRPDLVAKLGSPNHGFSIPLPAALADGKPHTVYVDAVDTANVAGSDVLLPGSPLTVVCTKIADAGAPPSADEDGGPSAEPEADAGGGSSAEGPAASDEQEPAGAKGGGCSASSTSPTSSGALFGLAFSLFFLGYRKRRAQ